MRFRNAAAEAARSRLMTLADGLAPTADQAEPPEPLRAAWRLDARPLRALAVVVGVVLLAVGWSWWNGRPLPEQAVPMAIASSSAPMTVIGDASTGSVVVDVSGDVGRPGLVTLPAGSRVADAIEEAGGATGPTDGVNLARVLVDGEQVVVGARAAGGGSGGAPSRLSINAADAAALDGLPGIGPVLAQRIVDWRTAEGPFATVEALGDVPGIGPSLLARLTPLVTT